MNTKALIEARDIARVASLNDIQRRAAEDLKKLRPPVLPGTNVIPDPAMRESFYRVVGAVIDHYEVKPGGAVTEFCNVAGIPD